MRTAAAFTNKRRVMAEAGNTKVQQIGNIATNYGSLQPVLPSRASPLSPVGCGPDFTHHTYFKGCRYLKHHPCDLIVDLTIPTLNYTYVMTVYSGDPGVGNFRPNMTCVTTILLSLNNINANGRNVTNLLAVMANATTITFYNTSNPNITMTVTVNSVINHGTYWGFACTIVSNSGTMSPGDNITFTYT
jgi:hypothetical protein